MSSPKSFIRDMYERVINGAHNTQDDVVWVGTVTYENGVTVGNTKHRDGNVFMTIFVPAEAVTEEVHGCFESALQFVLDADIEEFAKGDEDDDEDASNA